MAKSLWPHFLAHPVYSELGYFNHFKVSQFRMPFDILLAMILSKVVELGAFYDIRPLDLQLQQLQPLDGCSSNPWMDSDPTPNPNPNPNPRA